MTVRTAELGSARVITWDRQARRNAWDLDTMNALADALGAAGADEHARSVVVRGAGEHFSAGDDLFAALEADAEAWRATIEAFQRLTRIVLDLPLPVLAAIDGVCVGGALEFAASCDLRICTKRARFLTPEVTIGLVATNAATLLLPEVLGESAARDLLLTGGERDHEWALRHGFVSEVIALGDLDGRIGEWADRFDRTSRGAVAATKRMLNARFGELLAAAMDRETQACVELFDSPDAQSALQGFAARRSAAGGTLRGCSPPTDSRPGSSGPPVPPPSP